MKRLIDEQLVDWMANPRRKPLLLFGARQVGKTYALERFGSTHFDNYVHIDFSRNTSAIDIFEGSLDPKRIIPALEALSHSDIQPERTLIILDEIQSSERALMALKYFCEDAPEYALTAAGSLLGVKLREHGSFPVGKVDMKFLHPMSFEEYLWSRREERLSELIKEHLLSREKFPFHERALELYREYLLVGGMPDAVLAFNESESSGSIASYEAARVKQLEIDQAYIADIAKHAPSTLVPRIIDVWRSVPSQLARENKKFQYKSVQSGGRASVYEESVAWLISAAVVEKCVKVTEPVAPLGNFEDTTSFKLYRADTGLLSASMQVLPNDILPQSGKASSFRGALAENYVMQQFCSENIKTYYWGVPSKQEIDFLARNKAGDIIPMEVKSGDNVRSNSLDGFRRKYEPPYVVRFSTKNFGTDKFVQSIPLYTACYYAKEFIPSPSFV